MELHDNLCRSVFKNGTIGKKEYTAVWIALINQMQRKQATLASMEDRA